MKTLSVWTLVWLLCLSANAGADVDSEAWELLQRGKTLYHQGDLTGASDVLKQAQRRASTPVPTIDLYLGLSDAKLGHCLEGIAELDRFLGLKSDAQAAADANDVYDAMTVRDACKSLLASRSILHVETSPPGANVHIDADDPKVPSLGKTPLTAETVPNGEHLVSVQLNGYSPASRIVTLIPGQTTTIDVALIPLPPATTATQKAPVHRRRWFWPVVVGSAVVAAGIAVGVGVGVGTAQQAYPVLMFK